MKYKCKIPTGRKLCVRQSNVIRNVTNLFPFGTACILMVKSLKGHKMSKTDKIRETSFPGCSTRDMHDYIIKSTINKNQISLQCMLAQTVCEIVPAPLSVLVKSLTLQIKLKINCLQATTELVCQP